MNKVIGLTGTIGSGKSTVASLFKDLGWNVVDADDLARAAVCKGSQGLKEIATTFPSVIQNSGELDRKALGTIVFSDPKKKKELENIIHPIIRSLWLTALSSFPNNSKIMYVVPLLFETGREKYQEIQKVINVSTSEQLAINRVIQRDSLTYEEAQKRIRSQLANDERNKIADFIIKNETTIDDLKNSVTLLEKLL